MIGDKECVGRRLQEDFAVEQVDGQHQEIQALMHSRDEFSAHLFRAGVPEKVLSLMPGSASASFRTSLNFISAFTEILASHVCRLQLDAGGGGRLGIELVGE